MNRHTSIKGYKDDGFLRDQPLPTMAMHPKKFALWLIIVTIIMIFAAFTSAYLVRKGEGNWAEFELPQIFWWNTAVLFASSLTMQWAYYSAKRNNINWLKTAMVLTVLLGIGFLIGQWESWVQLTDQKIFFGGNDPSNPHPANPSGSFLYVLTGVHAFHLVTGLIFLLVVTTAVFQYKVHSKNMVRIDMCATYWHFLDVLWIYLFVFLLLNH